MLDPAAETITIGGVSIPLGDNRLLKARFEKYLSQPPENDEEAEAYRAVIQEILSTISPYHPGGPNLYGAFQLLPSASVYPGMPTSAVRWRSRFMPRCCRKKTSKG